MTMPTDPYANVPGGSVTWPGVQAPIACSYSTQHGITPGTATLELAPQTTPISEVGTLALKFGSVTISLPNCKADVATLRRDGNARQWSVSILDRRWKWRFGFISGRYNVREADGTIDPATEKTPQELASLLLDAMQETGYDVSDVPNSIGGTPVRPPVNWDFANPAQELQSFAEAVGTRVVLRLLTNTVALKLLGSGATLPVDVTTIEDSVTSNPPETPSQVEVVGGRAEYQGDVSGLEAVGMDVDGDVKPIDDLSYKPAVGWVVWDETFGNVVEEVALPDGRKAKPRELAAKTVWRWYRLPDSFAVAGLGTVSRDEMARDSKLVDGQVETIAQDGKEVRRPVEIKGVHWQHWESWGLASSNTASDRLIDKELFEYDAASGIVRFEMLALKLVNPGSLGTLQVAPADLTIRAAFLGDRTEFVSDVEDAPATTPPKVLLHDEIVVQYIDGTQQNLQAATDEAQYYLDAEAKLLARTNPRHVAWAGLRSDVDLDGAVQQIQISIGASGTTMSASRDNEFSLVVPPYRDRALREKLYRGARR